VAVGLARFSVAVAAVVPVEDAVSPDDPQIAQISPTLRKSAAPTAGNHIGVFGSGGGGGPCACEAS